jgi:putative FmdB family regulatory protein
MPIYGYTCTACGHAFDRLQKLSDPDPDACPVCGAAAVKRQVTAPSFRLAGAGWYETDFKKDGKRNLAGDASTPAADAKPADAKPAEATPAAAKSSQMKVEAKPAAEPKPASKA